MTSKISIVDSNVFSSPEYSSGDSKALLPFPINPTFTTKDGRVEAFVYDLDGDLLKYNPNADYAIIENGSEGNLENANSLNVFPEKEVLDLGLDIGSYNVSYNFLNNELSSSIENPFSLKQISSDRKELRLTTSFVGKETLKKIVNSIYPEVITSPYYPDFYVNSGGNKLSIANNILFDDTNNQYSILIKLYEPLPSHIKERDIIWVATKQRDSITYNVEFDSPIIKTLPPRKNILKGPNLHLAINNNIHTATKPSSLMDLQNLGNITTSSRNQLDSILKEKGASINIDYTDFSNFVHFSSATERVNNFNSKVGLIESYSLSLDDAPQGSGQYLSSSRVIIEEKINSLIENFDNFEYWMYYSSGSYGVNEYPQPYPKTTTTKPYILASTGSVDAQIWLENINSSSSFYDLENQDALIKTIPNYLLEDPNNAPYEKFINMLGQHFDVLFTYAQDITNRYNADNRLDFGISKNIVGEAIKSMGINLYTGNFNGYDLVDSLIGVRTPSILPDGQEGSTIDNYITASLDAVPVEDVNSEIYKRIYHNLPLLLRQKGSTAGLRTLITCFGLPDEVTKVKEFDIRYMATTQNLPAIGQLGDVVFPDADSVLPPSRDGYIPSTLLSPLVRVQQDYVKNNDYDRSLQYVEVGYSPQGTIDESSSFDPLNIGDFPDFNDFYFGKYINYYENKFINPASTTSDQDVTWDWASYIRYVKFLDSSLFNMIKDFIPVRSSLATGVIIKPTLKERSRQKPAQLSYNLSTYNGSADTLYYNWEGSNYILKAIGDYDARIKTGSFEWAGWTGGGWNASNQAQFSSGAANLSAWELSRDLPTPVKGLVQHWSESIYTQMGYAQQYAQTGSKIIEDGNHKVVHNTQDEFYNGIFKQTGIGSFDNYLIREMATGSSSDGAGVIRTDNNRFNPYKTPSDVTFTMTKENAATSQEWFDAINAGSEIIYNTSGYPDSLNLLIKHGDGTNFPTKETLLANGSSLNFENASGTIAWSISVGTPYEGIDIGLIDTSDYVFFDIIGGEDAFGGIGYAFSFAGTNALEYIAPFDPNDLDTQPGPWAYNEYNPLINNSSDPQAGFTNYNGIRKSNYIMDADYSPSSPDPTIPLNWIQLGSGSASKAPVQDSYYTSRWWINSRYYGVRNSSPDFNTKIIRSATNIQSTIASGIGADVSSDVPSSPTNTPPPTDGGESVAPGGG